MTKMIMVLFCQTIFCKKGLIFILGREQPSAAAAATAAACSHGGGGAS